MSIVTIDGNLLRKMIIAGNNELEKNKQLVDSLNVFPVPDGDTGTNMSLTTLAAAREVEKLNTSNAFHVAKAAANGALRGARGNSGVILSQLFRGFSKGIEGKALIEADDLAYALVKASEAAYKAVMKPKEGTILTVAKALGEKAVECSYDTDDLEEMLNEVIMYGHDVLKRTMHMLPELKQVGVVDAGGKGLLCILEGAFAAIHAQEDIKVGEPTEVIESKEIVTIAAADIKFEYCTEFFINISHISKETENKLKGFLQGIGDSVVMVGDEEIVKIHVHTNHPGTILEYALKLGSLSSLKIENMREQHTNLLASAKEEKALEEPPSERKDFGFVAVAVGDGMVKLFKDLGADEVIEGGQTMNPSTDDILQAIQKVNADNVFVLPNNKNIILTAQQAAELSKGCHVHSIPSKTMPQGIAALINFVPINSLKNNLDDMNISINKVITGQITYAVRDTVNNGKEIQEGDILCILENEIVMTSKSIEEGAIDLLEHMLENGGDLISIYYGEDISEEDATLLQNYAQEKYPECDVELHQGGQPLYYYIISIE